LAAGGSPNDIARIFSGYNDSIKSLGVGDAEQHLNNIKYFNQVNKDLAGQKTTQWGVNEYKPYQNKLKELTERIAADKINKNNAINDVIGGISNAGVSSSNQGLVHSLFGNKDGAVSDLPDGQKMWEQWKQQQEMDNARQGTDQLSAKWATDKPLPPKPIDLGLTDEQWAGLYKHLNVH
jgi:hypothetical protein